MDLTAKSSLKDRRYSVTMNRKLLLTALTKAILPAKTTELLTSLTKAILPVKTTELGPAFQSAAA